MTKKYQKDWKEMELEELATFPPTHTHTHKAAQVQLEQLVFQISLTARHLDQVTHEMEWQAQKVLDGFEPCDDNCTAIVTNVQ